MLKDSPNLKVNNFQEVVPEDVQATLSDTETMCLVFTATHYVSDV